MLKELLNKTGAKNDALKNGNNDCLNQTTCAIVILNEDNRKDFLCQARREGFKWANGDKIKAKDKCLFHIVLNLDFTILNVSTQCLCASKELKTLPRIDFDAINKINEFI